MKSWREPFFFSPLLLSPWAMPKVGGAGESGGTISSFSIETRKTVRGMEVLSYGALGEVLSLTLLELIFSSSY